MADWKDSLASAGKKIFGGGAAGAAASDMKSRPSKIDDKLKDIDDEAEGRKKSGVDKGEIGKKWDDSFSK